MTIHPISDDDPTAIPADYLIDATIVTADQFAAVDEPGAAPILGDDTNVLIPQGGDVMFYGDGGAGKTTLTYDLAAHVATGRDWLGIPVPNPASVLLIENEGPRALLRRKLARKLAAWNGPAPGERLRVLESPWGQATFADDVWRLELAARVREFMIDVIVAGPLVRLGFNEAGTLQQVAEFMDLIHEVRESAVRPLTVILVHHENRAGTVSGAWEGAGDTLVHVQAAGNGHTVVHVQKARWSSLHHHQTLKLAWTEGEGFELEGDRDMLADVRSLLSDGAWRTAKEISAPEDEGGIAANEKAVRDLLAQHVDLFESRTGDAAKALGRSPRATLYGLSQRPNSVDSVGESQGGAGGTESTESPLKGLSRPSAPPSQADKTESAPELSPLSGASSSLAGGDLFLATADEEELADRLRDELGDCE